jgi:hypothetical protein
LLSTNSPVAVLSLSGASLNMSWPVESAGFTLQSRTNLFEGNWFNETSVSPQIVGGQWQVTVPLSGNADSTFYRLVK